MDETEFKKQKKRIEYYQDVNTEVEEAISKRDFIGITDHRVLRITADGLEGEAVFSLELADSVRLAIRRAINARIEELQEEMKQI